MVGSEGFLTGYKMKGGLAILSADFHKKIAFKIRNKTICLNYYTFFEEILHSVQNDRVF